MIRSWTLAAIAGGLAACSSIDAVAADGEALRMDAQQRRLV
jgi:hypothetical protein